MRSRSKVRVNFLGQDQRSRSNVNVKHLAFCQTFGKHLSGIFHNDLENTLHLLYFQFSELKLLDLSNIAAVRERSVCQIVRRCTNLQSLNLSLCTNIGDNCAAYIAETALKLKSLYMVSCNITDKGECDQKHFSPRN